MDLTSPKIIKELLAKYETRPSKGLGQNFLIDKNVLEKIVESAEIKSNDTILEVGPGIGTLTQELVHPHTKVYVEAYGVGARKVIAVEKDPTMCKILKETLIDFNNVKVVNDDILRLDPETLLKSDFHRPVEVRLQQTRQPHYKVVANIPYYLTSPLIRKFLECDNPPSEMVLMLQKEVAQRICAKPPKMSLLAVSVQFYAEAKIISYVSKNCFWPSPKVDSAIIKIMPRSPTSPEAGLCRTSRELFFQVVKAGFSQPRKQLAGNLSKGFKLDKEKTAEWLLKNKINPSQRAETLNLDDWKNLGEDLTNALKGAQ